MHFRNLGLLSLRNLLLFALLGLVACSSATPQALNYNEATQGDLSDNHLAPTPLAFAKGINSVSGTTGLRAGGESVDRDYFWFTVPETAVLTKVILTKYTSLDEIAFAAIQRGRVLNQDPENTEPSALLGWLHLGLIHVNQNILNDLGKEATAQGFTPPLGPGDYTFWVQQTGLSTTYTLSFTLE